jgi:hypothetical protein
MNVCWNWKSHPVYIFFECLKYMYYESCIPVISFSQQQNLFCNGCNDCSVCEYQLFFLPFLDGLVCIFSHCCSIVPDVSSMPISMMVESLVMPLVVVPRRHHSTFP